jgi:hypothetical protein
MRDAGVPRTRLRLEQGSGSAFSPYMPTAPTSTTAMAAASPRGADEPSLKPGFCFVCVDMARDTPGSPMSRSAREQLAAAAGATATLTSGAYHAAEHAAAAAAAALHGNALQQKILEVMYDY